VNDDDVVIYMRGHCPDAAEPTRLASSSAAIFLVGPDRRRGHPPYTALSPQKSAMNERRRYLRLQYSIQMRFRQYPQGGISRRHIRHPRTTPCQPAIRGVVTHDLGRAAPPLTLHPNHSWHRQQSQEFRLPSAPPRPLSLARACCAEHPCSLADRGRPDQVTAMKLRGAASRLCPQSR
jgi:hypothetical protein